MPAKAEIKTGFWVGIGVALALAVFGAVQLLILRAAHKDG
jgi:hypothetical protein